MATKRLGRRRLGRMARRSLWIAFRCRADEAAAIQTQARAAGLTLSELARRALLGERGAETRVASATVVQD